MTITDSSFDKSILASAGAILVDFWAEWCGPCRALGPALEELAEDNVGKLQVAKLNIDDNPTSRMRYGVRAIPTMILFKDGMPIATHVGVATKSQLQKWVESKL